TYLLTIAFSNLIENNCKYSKDNSSFVQISYWDKWTIIRMSDDGIGMTEKDLENLFKLFYRGEQDGVVEGHGIGMALSQKIINTHDGNIAVHSEKGRGTTFVVQLPHL
ncbi:MAG: sensor histidine kinase, partial [Prevotella sp.]|nr:sensor histidine kinase [Prevotella sp.]